jgi:hypothetical protein
MFCNEEGFITPVECVTFIKSTTNTLESLIDVNDNRIVGLLKEYGKTKFGCLNEEEFLRFYTEKAFQKPDVVWNNLNIMKYGNDLRHQ